MTQPSYQTLHVEMMQSQILQLTLNRPERFNAINSQMMLELRDFWQNTYIQSTARCIILTGTAPAFCAGADLKERFNLDIKIWQQQKAVLEQAILAMLECPVPIIAAVNGVAYGGGLELVLASDFAYAADSASFAQPEVKVGLMPGALGTQQLPRACGARRAKELAFTGKSFSAQEAKDWGIVNQVFNADTLLDEVHNVAQTICKNAPLAVRQVKKAMTLSEQVDIKSGFAFELEAYNRLLDTHDRQEGIKAFNEKRQPNFTGK